MKNKRTTYLAIGFLMAIIYVAVRMSYTKINDQQTVSKVSLKDYDNLFNQKAMAKLQIYSTVKSKHRLPESSYIFDSRYNIFVYSVILSDLSSLEKVLNVKNEATSINGNGIYGNAWGYNFDMNKKQGSTDSVSNVNFKFSGDSIRVVAKSDSILCYNFKFQTFSLSYNNHNDTYDVVAKASNTAIPANIEFIKKGKLLYIMIMTVANGKENLQPDLLYNITTK